MTTMHARQRAVKSMVEERGGYEFQALNEWVLFRDRAGQQHRIHCSGGGVHKLWHPKEDERTIEKLLGPPVQKPQHHQSLGEMTMAMTAKANAKSPEQQPPTPRTNGNGESHEVFADENLSTTGLARAFFGPPQNSNPLRVTKIIVTEPKSSDDDFTLTLYSRERWVLPDGTVQSEDKVTGLISCTDSSTFALFDQIRPAVDVLRNTPDWESLYKEIKAREDARNEADRLDREAQQLAAAVAAKAKLVRSTTKDVDGNEVEVLLTPQEAADVWWQREVREERMARERAIKTPKRRMRRTPEPEEGRIPGGVEVLQLAEKIRVARALARAEYPTRRGGGYNAFINQCYREQAPEMLGILKNTRIDIGKVADLDPKLLRQWRKGMSDAVLNGMRPHQILYDFHNTEKTLQRQVMEEERAAAARSKGPELRRASDKMPAKTEEETLPFKEGELPPVEKKKTVTPPPWGRLGQDSLSAKAVAAVAQSEAPEEKRCKHCNEPLSPITIEKGGLYCGKTCRDAWSYQNRKATKRGTVEQTVESPA